MIEFCRMLDLDPMLIDIVHTATSPAFLIVCERKVIALAMDDGISRLPCRAAEPDIVVVVGIGMAQDQVDIVAVGSIFPADIEAESWAEAALPFLAGKDNIFFEDIGGEGTGNPLKTGSDKKKAEAIFQGIEIYMKVATYNTFKTCSFAFSSSSFIRTTHCWIVES